MSPAISFSGESSRGKFYELILRGEKFLTTRYPRVRGQIQAGDVANLYWKQRTPIKDKPIHLIGKAHILHVFRMPSLLDAILRISDYMKGEGFADLNELVEYWTGRSGAWTPSGWIDKAAQEELMSIGPLDIIIFKLIKENDQK